MRRYCAYVHSENHLSDDHLVCNCFQARGRRGRNATGGLGGTDTLLIWEKFREMCCVMAFLEVLFFGWGGL
jgi:hypothetical protein